MTIIPVCNSMCTKSILLSISNAPMHETKFPNVNDPKNVRSISVDI
jgi:hypothetical protein